MSTVTKPGTRPPPPFMRGKKGRQRRNRVSRGDGLVGPRASNGTSNVAIVVTYHQGDTNIGKFKWPTAITEKQGLNAVLSKLSDIDEIYSIGFSQVAHGSSRIPWIDAPPNGLYLMNQEYDDDYVEPQGMLEDMEAEEPIDPDFHE